MPPLVRPRVWLVLITRHALARQRCGQRRGAARHRRPRRLVRRCLGAEVWVLVPPRRVPPGPRLRRRRRPLLCSVVAPLSPTLRRRLHAVKLRRSHAGKLRRLHPRKRRRLHIGPLALAAGSKASRFRLERNITIRLAGLRIAEDLVGGGDFAKLRDGLWAIVVHVRMQVARLLPVGGFHGLVRVGWRDASEDTKGRWQRSAAVEVERDLATVGGNGREAAARTR